MKWVAWSANLTTRRRRRPRARSETTAWVRKTSKDSTKTESLGGSQSRQLAGDESSSGVRTILKSVAPSLVRIRNAPGTWSAEYSTIGRRGTSTRGAAEGRAVGITPHSLDVYPSAEMKRYWPLWDRDTSTSKSTLSSWKTFTSWLAGAPMVCRQTAFPRLAESARM